MFHVYIIKGMSCMPCEILGCRTFCNNPKYIMRELSYILTEFDVIEHMNCMNRTYKCLRQSRWLASPAFCFKYREFQDIAKLGNQT